eukprot:s3750_g13.t1
MRFERCALLASLAAIVSLTFMGSRCLYASPPLAAMELATVPSSTTATTTSHLPTLVEAMRGAGTDKGPGGHKYYRYYRKWFAEFQQKAGLKLLEIGAQAGGSLLAWSRYFANAELIMGLAYGDHTEGVEDRAKGMKKVVVRFGDQGHKETMQFLIEDGPWDLIIDDGSHYPPHMIFSFFHLWNSVKWGGVYVIEDLETNYWRDGRNIYDYIMKGDGIWNGPNLSAVAKLQQFEHILVRHQIGAPQLSIMQGDHNICSIEWGMNIVAIKKCSEDERANNPDYRNNTAHRFFDEQAMAKWINQARSTNPTM